MVNSGSVTRRVRSALGAALAAALVLADTAPATAADGEQVHLRVVGGLGGARQFSEFEMPFWSRTVTEESGGRIVATVHAFDQSGLHGQEMLHLIRLGVVPFGTAVLGPASADEPELGAMDLPGLNPDFAALRRSVGFYRPHVRRMLAERYGIELLGIYPYPAQVLFCVRPFARLSDLAGRRVRTSSTDQSALMAAVGAVPVVTPFAETRSAVEKGLVDCAVTGTLSGNGIGLHEVTTHVHRMAVGWGLSVFGANTVAWNALPGDVRDRLRSGIADLESRIWAAAEQDTEIGLACNSGQGHCPSGRRGRMTVVPAAPEDEARRRTLLTGTVLPRWIERCGADCIRAWNATLAQSTGIRLAEGGEAVDTRDGSAGPGSDRAATP